MSAQSQRVLTWLNDAYTMETDGATTLKQHAEAAGDYPSVQAKLQRHAEETRRHAERVKGCIQRRGGKPSAAREALGTALGTARGVATRAAKDTVVKNVLADYAAEHFEIACYKSLIAAAEKDGDAETARVCRDILREEEAMVASLEGEIDDVTEQFLVKRARSDKDSGARAARGGQSGGGGKTLLKGAQQNVLPIVGGLVASAGAGLLLTRVLSGGNQGSRGGNQDQDDDYGGYNSYRDLQTGADYTSRDADTYEPSSIRTSEGFSDEALQYGSQNDLQGDVRAADLQDTLQGGSDIQNDGPNLQGSSPDEVRGAGKTLLVSGGSPDTYSARASSAGVSGTDSSLSSLSAEATETSVGTSVAEDESSAKATANEVMSRLKQYRQVDRSDIEVTVEKNGRVTLKGTVDNEDIKRQAQEAVGDVLSVSELRNQLRVTGRKRS